MYLWRCWIGARRNWREIGAWCLNPIGDWSHKYLPEFSHNYPLNSCINDRFRSFIPDENYLYFYSIRLPCALTLKAGASYTVGTTAAVSTTILNDDRILAAAPTVNNSGYNNHISFDTVAQQRSTLTNSLKVGDAGHTSAAIKKT